MSTGAQLIQKFELYVDDTTELSSQEELDLLNKIYHRVCNDRPWEFLRTSASGFLSTSVPYVALPANFGYLTENNNATNNGVQSQNNAGPKVVFIGASYAAYQIINYSDRRQYLNRPGYAYIDIANSRLVFTSQPTVADTYEFDYIQVQADLTTTSSPIFPGRFEDMLYHGMATDDYIIQIFDKAKSYAQENQAMYTKIFNDLVYWNAQLLNY